MIYSSLDYREMSWGLVLLEFSQSLCFPKITQFLFVTWHCYCTTFLCALFINGVEVLRKILATYPHNNEMSRTVQCNILLLNITTFVFAKFKKKKILKKMLHLDCLTHKEFKIQKNPLWGVLRKDPLDKNYILTFPAPCISKSCIELLIN